MKIGEICRTGVVKIRADEGVLDAARRMRRFHVGDLIVVDEREALPIPVGIITDRDIVVGLVAQEVTDLTALRVSDVISTDELVTARMDDDVATAVERMRQHGVRRIPIVDDNGVLSGIFTMDDALQYLTDRLADIAAVAHRQQRAEHSSRP